MSKYIKDISGETPDIETYLYVKDYISKYQLNIDINSNYSISIKEDEINVIPIANLFFNIWDNL